MGLLSDSIFTPLEELELFQLTFERLTKHRLILKSKPVKLRFRWEQGKGTRHIIQRPPLNDIEGYMALLRGFLSNDDYISVEGLTDVYYRIKATKYQARVLKDMRRDLREWMNRPIGLNVGDIHFTPALMFELFIYGGVLHMTKKSLLDKICVHHESQEMFFNRLMHCIYHYTKFLGRIYRHNRWVIFLSRKTAIPLP